MMNLKATQRGIAISGIVILITAGNYFRLTGTEMIRPIHIVTLLTCGAAIGVFIMSIVLYFKSRKEE
jgi:hypothetical protein